MRKNINDIMKELNSNYTGKINNTVDVFRVFKAFRKNKHIDYREQSLIKLYLILIGISWFSFIILMGIFIVWNEQIL
jgi:hypothetical protein